MTSQVMIPGPGGGTDHRLLLYAGRPGALRLPSPASPRSMTRVFNFSPGPATLPEPVLRQAASEMLDWNGSGMSVMEMSHRGKEFMSIHAEAEELLAELMGIP